MTALRTEDAGKGRLIRHQRFAPLVVPASSVERVARGERRIWRLGGQGTTPVPSAGCAAVASASGSALPFGYTAAGRNLPRP